MHFENLEFSTDGKIAFFQDLSIRAGITTIDFGDCGFGNNDQLLINSQLIMLSQTDFFCKLRVSHSDGYVSINQFNKLEKFHSKDAIFFIKREYDNYNPLLVSNSADCPIIILGHPKQLLIAVIHSGWKSTAKNIVGKTIKKIIKQTKESSTFFGRDQLRPEEIEALVWPGICENCYEVGWDMEEHFPDYIKNGKMSLAAIIKNQLQEIGVTKIIFTNACSSCSKDKNGEYLFHSFRREKNGLRNCVFAYLNNKNF